MRLLDPKALNRIHRLELIAQGVMEGFIAGRHRSPYKGFSSEFAEHREYTPGDNIRNLDWRVFGRSDRYYIKQYIEETNLRATILLDASASMTYRGGAAARQHGGIPSKFEYGRYLAASLAHLLIHQQDAVGLVTFDTQIRGHIPPRSRASHLRAILEMLESTQPGAETDLARIFHDIAEKAHRRGLMIIISDLFADPNELLKAFHHLRFRKHEIIVLHVMAEEELTFPFDRWSLFTDLEMDTRHVEIDPRSVRAAYLAELQKYITTLENGCGRMRVDYAQLSTGRPFDEALSDYLANRRFLLRATRRGTTASAAFQT
jgi:uncharacterized protein (DUF58 family)